MTIDREMMIASKQKVKRKMWVMVFGLLEFKQIHEIAVSKYNLDVLKMFKPDMMVDIHMGVRGRICDIQSFKDELIANKHTVVNRCPKRSFQFEI